MYSEMEMIATAYKYLFFFLFNWLNSKKDNILIQPKAVFLIIILEASLILSICNYYLDIYKIDMRPSSTTIMATCIIAPLVIINALIFERNKLWTTYIAEFESWSDEKRKNWNRISRIIILFVIGNLILSFYIMANIDWRQYGFRR